MCAAPARAAWRPSSAAAQNTRELLLIAGMIIVVAVTAFETRLGIAAPVLLVVIGAGCSLIPGIEHPVIEPEWILAIVLPLLRYAAAVNMPATDLRRDIGSIGALSVVLVLASAVVIGVVLSALVPGLSLAAGIALGAVISPTDAVAATSIGKRLGLPPRLLTILEGEGLVNDATALVLLRTAIAATAGAFSFWGIEQVRQRHASLPRAIAESRRRDDDAPFAQRQELHRMLLEAEQSRLHEARSEGAFSSAVLAEAQALIDQGLWRGPNESTS